MTAHMLFLPASQCLHILCQHLALHHYQDCARTRITSLSNSGIGSCEEVPTRFAHFYLQKIPFGGLCLQGDLVQDYGIPIQGELHQAMTDVRCLAMVSQNSEGQYWSLVSNWVSLKLFVQISLSSHLQAPNLKLVVWAWGTDCRHTIFEINASK